jgi:hypothetical protein
MMLITNQLLARPGRLIFGSVLVALSAVVLFVLFPPWHTHLNISQPAEVAFHWIGSPPSPVPDPGFASGGNPYFIDVFRLAVRVAIIAISSVAVVSGFVALSTLRRRNQR